MSLVAAIGSSPLRQDEKKTQAIVDVSMFSLGAPNTTVSGANVDECASQAAQLGALDCDADDYAQFFFGWGDYDRNFDWDVLGDIGCGIHVESEPAPEVEPASAEDPALFEDMLEHAADGDGGGDSHEGDIGEPTPEGPMLSAHIDCAGFIKTAAIQYSSCKMPMARMATWPDSKPLPQRAITLQCYMHPACKIIASRKRHSDDLLLRWLFAGRIVPPGASADEKAVAKREHQALWAAMKAS